MDSKPKKERMNLRAIIVEDELPARETLEMYLKKYCPTVNIVGAAKDANEALELIRSTPTDLVFLDVELPYGNAFDLLEKVGDIQFETIFITAYAQYAMEALNHNALHYILKPIGIEELIKAVDKVSAVLEQKHDKSPNILPVKDYHSLQTKKFVFPNLNGFELVDLYKIVHCRADDNYTEFYFTDGSKKLISKTLKKVEDQLKDYGFLRVHKSHLVNLNHIVSYQKGKTGALLMSDHSEVSITTSKKAILMEILDLEA
jgi:two-component system LytT family response regulator